MKPNTAGQFGPWALPGITSTVVSSNAPDGMINDPAEELAKRTFFKSSPALCVKMSS